MADENAQAAPTAEDRINALLAKSEQATAQAESTAAANALLTARLARLENTITSIAQPRSSEAPPKAASTSQSAGSVDIAELVRGIVNEAITPLVEDKKAQAERDQRAAKHQVAWTQAVRENPELNDPASPLRAAAERLWQGKPELQALDDAPLIVAHLARSVLAEARATENQKTEVKRTAGVAKPTPITQRTQFTASDADRAIADVRESAAEEGVASGAGPRTFQQMFRASLTEQLRNAE